MPVVYLLHFDRPYKHARHYLGYAENLERRLRQHRKGTGARLMEVIRGAGIDFKCVRVWDDGTRSMERKLKKWKKSSQLCPCCTSARKLERWADKVF